MLNSVGIAGQHTLEIEESGPNLKGQLIILATLIALVFYLVLAIIAPLQADATLAQTVAHDTIANTLSLGNYTLTIYEDNSMELSWITELATPTETHQTGVWVNERAGSIAINR